MKKQGCLLNPGYQFTDRNIMVHLLWFWNRFHRLVIAERFIQRTNIYTVRIIKLFLVERTSTWMNTRLSQGLKYLHIPTCTYLQNIFYISNCQIWFCSFGIKLFFYLLFYTVQYFRHIIIQWSILPFPEKGTMKHKFFSKTINSIS